MMHDSSQRLSGDLTPHERLLRVELMLTGMDGTNGLRSRMTASESRLSILEAWRQEWDSALRIGYLAIRWGALAVVALLAATGSDEAVLTVLRAVRELSAIF